MTHPVMILVVLAGCDLLGPRTADVVLDGPPSDTVDAFVPRYILPAQAEVPSVADNAELVSQIKIFDGLSDSALATANGIVTRGTGKAAGVTVRYWSFGTVPVVDGFISSALLYVLVDDDGAGTLTPRTDHPWLIDSIPGDLRYSAIRRVVYVPVTATYAGERLTSIEALSEAIDLGLVGEPIPAGVWRNMPVVPPGTRLEISTAGAPLEVTEVYGRGYRVGGFPLAIPQPFRNNQIPMGQESRLLSGVATGIPPIMTTTVDAQPVFQYGIPATAPTTAFNYTPVATAVDVRLADAVAATDINHDVQLFRRASNGSISGYYVDNVASYAVTTLVSNQQIQFVDGAP